MATGAKISASSASAQPLGLGNYGSSPKVQNLGPNAAYVYGGALDGVTDAEQAAQVVALGEQILSGKTWEGPVASGGVDLSTFFVACAADETADLRVEA